MKLLSFCLLSLAMTTAGEPMCDPGNYSSTAPAETSTWPYYTEPTYTAYNCVISGYVYDSESEMRLRNVVIDVPQAGIKDHFAARGEYSFGSLKSGTYTVIARHEGYATDSCRACVDYNSNIGHCKFGLKQLSTTGQ